MDEAQAKAAGEALARRHSTADADPDVSLLNYAESSRAGDWSFRSALMRMAQPEPQRVADVLELSRRLDAVLRHVGRALARSTVTCDRLLRLDGTEPTAPYPDARSADIARLVELVGDHSESAIEAYSDVTELTSEERMAVPLVGVALEFDRLADELAAWAADRTGPPPVDQCERACEIVRSRLDELGVPEESAPPPGFRGRG